MGELALPEGDVVPLLVPKGDDGLLQEGQRLVDVGGFLQDSALRLQTRGGSASDPGRGGPTKSLPQVGLWPTRRGSLTQAPVVLANVNTTWTLMSELTENPHQRECTYGCLCSYLSR